MGITIFKIFILGAIKLNLRPNIWRSTSTNQYFEYSYPLILFENRNRKVFKILELLSYMIENRSRWKPQGGGVLWLISMHFRAFFKVKGTELGNFLGLLKFQIFFWGAWYSWYFLGVNGRPWVRAYVYGKNKSTPPPPPPPPLVWKPSCYRPTALRRSRVSGRKSQNSIIVLLRSARLTLSLATWSKNSTNSSHTSHFGSSWKIQLD